MLEGVLLFHAPFGSCVVGFYYTVQDSKSTITTSCIFWPHRFLRLCLWPCVLLAMLCWAVMPAFSHVFDMVGISPHGFSFHGTIPEFQRLHDNCEVSSTLSATIHRITTTRGVVVAPVDDP